MMLTAILTFLSSNILFLLLYLNTSSSYPKPLNADEEEKLLQQSMAGDLDARNKLIEHNMRLVVHVVKKYYASGQDQEDLISIGTIGLIKAISSFQPCKGTKLATYSARCIENEILMYFRSIRKTNNDVSLNEAIDTDSDGNCLSLIDILSCEDSFIDSVDTEGDRVKINRLFKTILTDQEKTILEARYGLNGKEEETQNVIAKRMHISRSYVSRIEKRALEKLKDAMSAGVSGA